MKVQTECKHPWVNRTNVRQILWQEGESKFNWNSAGTYKCSAYDCGLCGATQEYTDI